jgi:hypothetical protein
MIVSARRNVCSIIVRRPTNAQNCFGASVPEDSWMNRFNRLPSPSAKTMPRKAAFFSAMCSSSYLNPPEFPERLRSPSVHRF